MSPRAAVAALALALGFAPGATGAAELRVAMIPDEAPAELLRKFEPLEAYLEQSAGVTVRLVPVTDYAGVVEGLAAGRVDLAWLGGFGFVQVRRRTGTAVPLVQREEDARFHSKVIVPAHSKAKTLGDLKGASFAFGAAGSTSGHLMPRYYLLQQGIDADKHFAKVAYTGAHDATVRWVAAGRVDAGAVNELILEKLLSERRVDPAKVRVLWTSPEYPDYCWTVRGDLDPALVARLKAAFLALDYQRPEHRPILDLQLTRKFVPTSVANYDLLTTAAIATGLMRGPQKEPSER